METERNFYILLRHDGKVNEPWLERQALVLEESLIAEASILGPSVTANFAANGFELDFTVKASSEEEAFQRAGHALAVVQRAAGIQLAPVEEIRASYTSTEAIPA